MGVGVVCVCVLGVNSLWVGRCQRKIERPGFGQPDSFFSLEGPLKGGSFEDILMIQFRKAKARRPFQGFPFETDRA